MKLYATVSSERATKGQGGNEYLEVNLYDEEQDIIATIGIKPKRFVNDTQVLQIGYNGHFTKIDAHDMAESGSDFWGVKDKTKGKQQKDEDPVCKHGVNLKYNDCHNCDKGQ